MRQSDCPHTDLCRVLPETGSVLCFAAGTLMTAMAMPCFPKVKIQIPLWMLFWSSSESATLSFKMPYSEGSHTSPTCLLSVLVSPLPHPLGLETVLIIKKSKMKLFTGIRLYSNSVGSWVTFKTQQNVKCLSRMEEALQPWQIFLAL